MSLEEFLKLKYGDLEKGGWIPKHRARFGYLTPDDRYEFAVSGSITTETNWLDVGCGRFVFAGNQKTAAVLASRCKSLTGIDPSNNIAENDLLANYNQCSLEEFRSGEHYDLITLRMVVEHMTDPEGAVAALARLSRSGSRIIVYTVNRWSPISILSAATPISVHLLFKRLLWGGDDRDTFPTVYRMNTRRTLRKLFAASGFTEHSFERLSDTRVTSRSKTLNTMELCIWRGLRAIGLVYPENCLLGIYIRR